MQFQIHAKTSYHLDYLIMLNDLQIKPRDIVRRYISADSYLQFIDNFQFIFFHWGVMGANVSAIL